MEQESWERHGLAGHQLLSVHAAALEDDDEGALFQRLEYFADGNVRERAQQNVVEQFTYDGLDRLASWTPDALVSTADKVTYGYDDTGTLRSRSYRDEAAIYEGDPTLTSLSIIRGGATTVESYVTDGWGRLPRPRAAP